MIIMIIVIIIAADSRGTPDLPAKTVIAKLA